MPIEPTVLLVDDDERLRRAAGKVLAAAGYRVVSASSGREALETLQEHPVALAICDLRLPDLDGIALLQQARRLRPDIEVVMITGHGSVEKAVEAMRLGAYDFIEKPVDSTGLLKVVGKALERRRLSRENKRLRRELDQGRGLEALMGADRRQCAHPGRKRHRQGAGRRCAPQPERTKRWPAGQDQLRRDSRDPAGE